jgi:hypothetical protein
MPTALRQDTRNHVLRTWALLMCSILTPASAARAAARSRTCPFSSCANVA